MSVETFASIVHLGGHIIVSSPAPSSDDESAMSATDTVIYLEMDPTDLRPDDRAAIGSYAAKYVTAGSTDQVTVTGWVSVEGDKNHNETPAKQRAKTVADYIASKSFSKNAHDGSGPTNRFGSHVKSNRCPTIEPKPPAPASSGVMSSPAPAPTPPQPATVQPPVSTQDLHLIPRRRRRRKQMAVRNGMPGAARAV